MKKCSKIRSSANSLYDFYKYSTDLIQYNNGFKITQGIQDILFEEDIESIIKLIIKHKINYQVEIWEFSRNKHNLFTLSAKDKSGLIFVDIANLESNFFFDDIIIIKKQNLLCLPIEEKLY